MKTRYIYLFVAGMVISLLLHGAEFHYDLDFKSNRLKNVTFPIDPMDAANKQYVDNQIGYEGGWTDDGELVRLTEVSDKVLIGVTSGGEGKLYVETGDNKAVYGKAQSYGIYGNAAIHYGVYGRATTRGVYGYAAENYGVYGYAGKNYGVYGYAVDNYGVYGLAQQDFGVYGNAGNSYGVYGYAAENYGVYGLAPRDFGVYGNALNSYGVYGRANNIGVRGYALDNNGVSGYAYNYGVYGKAYFNAVYGNAINRFGVYGNAVYSYGVYGRANTFGVYGDAINNGVYGQAYQHYGGYFTAGSGNALYCAGNMMLGMGYNIRWSDGTFKAFEIDHPLDPKNKILRHFCMEGPEALVIYRGVAVINKNGEAEVKLPQYVDALSRDPHIQVTPVGDTQVHVKKDVLANEFVIGGEAGTKVYWQVTAERDDPRARLERIYRPVEQEKSTPGAPAIGMYFSPECYK
jgi:hypothetical protein